MLKNNPLFHLMDLNETDDNPKHLLDKYWEIEKILNDSRLDYTYIERIIEYIKFMEMAYMYPNTLGKTYFENSNAKCRCPINATMDEVGDVFTMSVPGLLMNGVYQSRFLIFVVIEVETRDISVMVKDMDNDGRYYSRLKFNDSNPFINQDRPFDRILLKNIVRSINSATMEVIDVYLGFKGTDKYKELEKMVLTDGENLLKNELKDEPKKSLLSRVKDWFK